MKKTLLILLILTATIANALDANIPEYTRSDIIDITGTATPGATLTLKINGETTRKQTTTTETYLFKEVQLQTQNTIEITEEGGETKTYTTTVDKQPPTITITAPQATTTQTETITITTSEPTEIQVLLENQEISTQNGTNIQTQIPLALGQNNITIKATDKAGYTSTETRTIIHDTGPPIIEVHNLDKLGPVTYQQAVRIKGKTNEQSAITIFINGQPEQTKTTDQNGNFDIQVDLERTSTETQPLLPQATAKPTDTTIGWKNTLKLEAIDLAGLKTTTPEYDVTWALCGFGTWINVNWEKPMPDILTPRLLTEGLQTLGIGYTYKYTDDKQATIQHSQIKATPIKLSPEFQKDYDNNLITLASLPAKAKNQKEGQGYIQIRFNPLDDPWALFGDKKPANATQQDKELYISEHRKGHCGPGGCMKLFVELEIPFQETTTIQPYGQIATQQAELKTQKQCLEIPITIDQRIPTDLLPDTLIKDSEEALTDIIDALDSVLKPLNTLGKYLFYACTTTTFAGRITQVIEDYHCQTGNVLDAVTGGDAFDPRIAEINKCKDVKEYTKEQQDKCQSCADAKQNTEWFHSTQRKLCDRIHCPSAPTLQSYIKDKANRPLSTIEGTDYKVGNDCTAWAKQTGKDPRLITHEDMKDLYSNWQTHKADTDKTIGINCYEPHPATPECCGYEYMNEWSSACGIPGIGANDLFNEIKESTCLSAQKTNQNTIASSAGTETCNSIVNAAAGFCDKQAGPSIQHVRVTQFAGLTGEQPTGPIAQYGLGLSKEKYMYILLIPDANKRFIPKLGFIGETLQLNANPTVASTLKDTDRHPFQSQLEFVELPDPSAQSQLATLFSQENMDKYYAGKPMPDVYAEFKKLLCLKAEEKETCNVDGKAIYEKVMAVIGTPDQEYIIQPNKGLINPLRCVCVPTTIAQLEKTRNILNTIKQCFTTITTTGDGAPGVCQEAISQNVCDLLYEAFSCFTQKYSTPTARPTMGGNILAALTGTGSEFARQTEERYGDAPTYKAVFVDRKLLHSTCMFAFTGTWNLDLAKIYDTSINEVPIDSTALLYPCNRRFMSYNPLTQPPGLVNWLYNFNVFIAAGSDIDVELKLKCSGGYNCKESEGFTNGKCDCDTPREISIRPKDLPSKVLKGDILNTPLYYEIQGNPGEGAIRYDKAQLIYKWNDGKKIVETKGDDCTITQTGGQGALLGICQFNPLTQTYGCTSGDNTGQLQIPSSTTTYPPLRNTYAVGDNINVTLLVRQNHQGQPIQNKHIEWTIYDTQGKEIKTNKDETLVLLQNNGDYHKIIGTTESGRSILVEKQWFETQTGPTTITQMWKTGLTRAIPDTLIQNINVEENGQPYLNNKRYVLELINSGTLGQSYAIYQAGEPTITTGYNKGTELKSGPIPIDGKIIANDGTITITIQLTNARPATDEAAQTHINYNTIEATDSCTFANKLKPQRFTMKFKSYDSDKYGNPTDQTTIDPATGLTIEYETNINVICAEQGDSQLREQMEKAMGTEAPEELIKQILELTKTLLDQEQDYITQLQAQDDITELKRIATEIKTLEQQGATKVKEYYDKIVGTADSRLSNYDHQLRDLYEAIRQPTTEEKTKFLAGEIGSSNVQLFTDVIIERIAEVNKASFKLSIISSLYEATKIKNRILQSAKLTTGYECPDKQVVDGKYYECSINILTGANYNKDETRLCTLGTCYYVEEKTRCLTENIPPGKILKCMDDCSEVGYTPYMGTLNLLCMPSEGKTCCERPVCPEGEKNGIYYACAFSEYIPFRADVEPIVKESVYYCPKKGDNCYSYSSTFSFIESSTVGNYDITASIMKNAQNVEICVDHESVLIPCSKSELNFNPATGEVRGEISGAHELFTSAEKGQIYLKWQQGGKTYKTRRVAYTWVAGGLVLS